MLPILDLIQAIKGFWTFLVDGCCADRATDQVLIKQCCLLQEIIHIKLLCG